MSDKVKQLYTTTRFPVDEDSWPPNWPKDFIPLLFIQYQEQHTFKQSIALQSAKVVQTGNIPLKHFSRDNDQSVREVFRNSKTSKQLINILAPLKERNNSQLILIEGVAGIGKSLLLQEIAYRWAIGKLLRKFKLVLLIQLRNQAIQQASCVSDILQSICKGDIVAAEESTACEKYLELPDDNGKDIVFLLDGYDEFPEHLRKNSLIASILKRQILPNCGLVVSSRPHASVRLRQQAVIRVDILGFAEKDRKLYIEQSLRGHTQLKINELTKYVESNPAINGLCYIPFNMVILIHLYKQEIPLPENSTQLYNYFICLTICRHLAKSGQPLDNTITDLAKLPEPYNTVIKQLSKLSFEALNDNKLVFTLEEIKAICPDIIAIPDALNGFGLLQTVQHFGLAGETMTFNFTHFSIQEYLSAYHITQFSSEKLLQVLKEKFWSDLHSNMFAMYISITKGQQAAFKQFLSDGDETNAISEKFLKEQLKCIRLFPSFSEANDKTIYNSILEAKIFDDRIIDLSNTSFSINDVKCVTLFLISSPCKKWKKLNLEKCFIHNHGIRELHRDLMHRNIVITELDLSFNGLNESSSCFISDLTIHCGVEVLEINGNFSIGENPVLYDMLSHPSSKLVKLDMWKTKLSPYSAIALFTALGKGNKLKYLNIGTNYLTDETCDAISEMLKNNNCLVNLRLKYNDKISANAAEHLVQALQYNSKLQVLALPIYDEDVKKRIRSMQKDINKNRESRGCQVKLSIDYPTPKADT